MAGRIIDYCIVIDCVRRLPPTPPDEKNILYGIVCLMVQITDRRPRVFEIVRARRPFLLAPKRMALVCRQKKGAFRGGVFQRKKESYRGGRGRVPERVLKEGGGVQ